MVEFKGMLGEAGQNVGKGYFCTGFTVQFIMHFYDIIWVWLGPNALNKSSCELVPAPTLNERWGSSALVLYQYHCFSEISPRATLPYVRESNPNE